MKKLSLIAALTLSTMLSACGGGGGGHGYIPPTTLPDNPDNPDVNACATNPETCMTTKKFSNAEKRIELYRNVTNIHIYDKHWLGLPNYATPAKSCKPLQTELFFYFQLV